MIITESERLILRELEEADEAALCNVWGNAEVMKHCGGVTNPDIIPKVIRINRQAYQSCGYAVFAVVEKSSGALVGAAGCKPDAGNPRRAELIYHFSEAVWGNGYASEAVAALLQWAAAAQRLDYISASAVPENVASIRILEKNGFKQNGFVQFEDTNFVLEPFFELHLADRKAPGD